MSYPVDLKLPTQSPEPQTLTQASFKRGVITLLEETVLPPDALKEATNLMIWENGNPRPRWGSAWYGTAPSASAIDGATYYDYGGAIHLIIVAGGTVYRSTNDGSTWSTCTGATLTSGSKCYFEQAGGYLYIVDGVDNIVRYNGTTTLQTYTALSQPTAPTVTATGMTGSTYTAYYRIVAVNAVGFTQGSASGTATSSLPRSSWDSTHYMSLSWPAVTNALYYDIYFVDSTAQDALNNLVYVTSVGGTAYVDDGSAPLNNSIAVPIQNTSQGPTLSKVSFVGQSLYGTGDPNNKYRVWWTGAGNFLGYFASAYQGGYVDIQPGGYFQPVSVQDYRDGKGTPLATIWCKSSDGRGAIFQLAITSVDVSGGTVLVPSYYRLPGSRGTSAPNSIVNVLNDFYFYNTIGPAFYNLGSRAQFLNLLSTDEASINIRPSLQQITASASNSICAAYFLGKVFFSVPYGSSTNNAIVVYDTEQQHWLPKAFDFGVERFLQYTDTSGTLHLLFWKPGDSQLSEISQYIKGDYGNAFTTILTTGIMSVGKNRFDFGFVDQGEIEFSEPNGNITVNLYGIDRNNGFELITSRVMTPLSSQIGFVGWSTFAWSTKQWSVITSPPSLYAEPSAKRYFIITKELNAYQWNVTTSSVTSDYKLRTLQVISTLTDAGLPRQWLLVPS